MEVIEPLLVTLPKVRLALSSRPPETVAAEPRVRVWLALKVIAVVPVMRRVLIVWLLRFTPVPVDIETLSVLPALLMSSGE